MASKNVTIIPATKELFGNGNIADPTQKRRVAQYARVSTDSDEQFTSFESQVNFYTQYVSERPDWELVKVYTDEVISGLMTKNRDGFNEMISDALAGKIDLIITKSVSRFARNTVTTLDTIRRLKAKNVECYFEKENIWTFDGKGELLITIMGSLAQEESRSISQNVTWGKQKQMQDGKVSMAYKRFIGYRRGADGKPEVDPEEAEVVKHIYNLFINGYTIRQICNDLENSGVPSPAGKPDWSVSTVKSILTNEKYIGDALLQKTFTADYLNKVVKKNNGEIPQYYVKGSHPAIIPEEIYNLAQAEMAKSSEIGRGVSHASPFSNKVVCGVCGKFYTRRTFKTTKDCEFVPHIVWQCADRYKVRGKLCPADGIWEDELKRVFVEAFNQVIEGKDRHAELIAQIISLLCDTTALDNEEQELSERAEGLYSKMLALVKDNTKIVNDHDGYIREYTEMKERYEEVKSKLAGIAAEKSARKVKREKLMRFGKSLAKEDGILTEFDEHRFRLMVDSITVHSKKDVAVLFKNGIKVHLDIAKRRH